MFYYQGGLRFYKREILPSNVGCGLKGYFFSKSTQRNLGAVLARFIKLQIECSSSVINASSVGAFDSAKFEVVNEFPLHACGPFRAFFRFGSFPCFNGHN